MICLQMILGNYFRQIDELLSRDGQELEVGTVGHDVTDEGLDVVSVALELVQVGQLAFLVLQNLVGLVHPGPERAHLRPELAQLLHGREQSSEQLVRVVRDEVVALAQPLALGLKLVQLGAGENVGAGLDQLDDDVQGVVDWSVVVVHVGLDVLR